ncbi:hypothetical protein EIN_085880 [Entamoeba invadens IP1]|uniref:hypothetical protein n=1 Tax=Entamoeba invadens IP1 TaxID=370355 RepID=UPI0002C3F737|nr:hypothetical protein EIN_085880 [Entamoeba invadens IP1]ELP85336.1 hypothetical protein EIN_085880 [Entamoeba invadens IP1]|eukprot:XP_004184682.1 hypothetical protein EIN_085880 [Entamoeba invadens IP1]
MEGVEGEKKPEVIKEGEHFYSDEENYESMPPIPHPVEVKIEEAPVEKKEDVQVITPQPKCWVQSCMNKPCQFVVRITLWMKESVLKCFDYTFYVLVNSSKIFIQFTKRPVVKKVIGGTMTVALVGVAMYSFGYIPMRYLEEVSSLLL